MYKELLDKIKKMEVIEKGSRQRRLPFNPKEVTEETRKPIEKWIWSANQDDRNDIPRQEGNVRERALNKLHGLTESKKHPETGERMFLMHRGMSHEEHDELSSNDYNKGYKSSWSPKLQSAQEQADNNDGLVLSSWIPESQVHSSLAAYGESYESRAAYGGDDDPGSMTQDEQEIIVAPHQLNIHDDVSTPFEDDSHKNRFETREALQSSQIDPQEKQQQLKQTFSRQSARKKLESMASSEKMISGIAKSIFSEIQEDLEKGSRQRRMRFNPRRDVSPEERESVNLWTSYSEKEDRENIPEMHPNAKKRALHKLHGETDSKIHPETGERMFLMHRAMGDSEFNNLESKEFNKGYTSSWTPSYKQASRLPNIPAESRSKIVSAYIPESQIHHIPNAIGDNEFEHEKEIIVKPHELTLASQDFSRDKRQEAPNLDTKINNRTDPMAEFKMALSEDVYNKSEVISLIKDRIRKSLEDSDIEITEEELQKNIKRAFKTGLSLLGLIHGAQYMGDFPEEAPQKPQQAIERSIESPTELKEPAEYPMAPEQAQSNNNEDFLKAIRLTESSGGIDTEHDTMKTGIHKGTAAIGDYGLMPNTVNEMAVRMGRKHPLNAYAKMDQNQIRDSFQENPGHEKQIADFMADHVSKRFGGDEHKMAYAWFQGHNLTNDHFKNDEKHKNYQDHDYVKKYDKHIQLVRPPEPEGSLN